MAAVASVSISYPACFGQGLNDEPDPRDLMRPLRMWPAPPIAGRPFFGQLKAGPVLTTAIVPLLAVWPYISQQCAGLRWPTAPRSDP